MLRFFGDDFLLLYQQDKLAEGRETESCSKGLSREDSQLVRNKKKVH